jgi:hypothetical protein
MAMEEIPEERPLDPTKLMRIASMVREILDEARRMQPTKEAAEELASLYGRVRKQLNEALPEFLVTELDAMQLDLPFEDGATAEEVRMAYSGLIGWMTGLFQGLQASFQAQAAVHAIEKGPSIGDLPGNTNGKPKREGYL